MVNITRKKVLNIIENAIREVSESMDKDLSDILSEGTRIFGGDSPFDSMGVVNIIIRVEEGILEIYNVSVSLADERAMSRSRSPFRSIGTLADYIMEVLNKEIIV